MLVLDFINVGNGDSILVREVENGQTQFSLLVDCGHHSLWRDDHPGLQDPRSKRTFAGDFLRREGITHLDLILLTHFHRDHIGGLPRVLEAAAADRLMATYFPPENAAPLDPDGDNGLPKAARNTLRCMEMYRKALEDHPGRAKEFVEVDGQGPVTLRLTEQLTMDILCGEPALYPRQKAVCDAAFRGERNRYDLMRWGKAMNVSSLRQRLHYHGTEIVLGGDVYAAVWDNDTLSPCDILKIPHHASLSSTTRKLLDLLRPRTVVVSEAAGRPDERPHPYIISLIREFTQDVRFTDAVSIPGLAEPEYHHSVHLEIP